MNLSKVRGFFEPEKLNGRVNIIGCGSIGSTVAIELARFGITKITLWDFDRVEAKNIANQQYTSSDIGEQKVQVLEKKILDINPGAAEGGLKTNPYGWRQGDQLTGYVFLCVDSIETRRAIVEDNKYNRLVKAMFDFRMGLTDGQHFAANWKDEKSIQNFLATMQFTHEEAKAETPVSACNVELSVCPAPIIISSLGVANFINFINGNELRKFISCDAFKFDLLA